MKKNKKTRIFALLLIFAMVLTQSGFAFAAEGEPEGEAIQETEVKVEAQVSEPEPQPEPAPEAEPVKEEPATEVQEAEPVPQEPQAVQEEAAEPEKAEAEAPEEAEEEEKTETQTVKEEKRSDSSKLKLEVQSESKETKKAGAESFDFDDSTDLDDGVYSADMVEYTFTGGTGKARLDLEKLIVKNGKASATFTATSANMTHVYLDKSPSSDEDTALYDPKTDTMGPGVYKIENSKVTIPVKVGSETDFAARSVAMSEPHWINYQYIISVKSDAKPEFDNTTTLKDGTYTPSDYTFTGGTGKAKLTIETVTVKNGLATGTFTSSSASMSHVYLWASPSEDDTPDLYDPSTDKMGKDVYKVSNQKVTIPVRINDDVDLAARTTAMSVPHWVNYTYHITIDADAEPEEDPGDDPEPAVDPEPEDKGDETPSGGSGKLKDGTYKVLTTTDRKMFYIYPKEQDPAYSILTVKDGKMTATITLSGEGYDYVYMGTPSQAVKAGKSKWIKAKVVNGYYTFTIPVSKLDKKLTITPRSKKYANDPEMADQAWRPDKWIKFYSKGAIKIKDGDKSSTVPAKKKDKSGKSGKNQTSGEQTEFSNDNKKDKVSKYSDDSSGSTSAVNASTTLKDGVYTPDYFSWSGGSGRLAYIRCNKITVTGGQAYATIEFSSSSYDQLRANGKVYSWSGGGNSTFVIPVKLNANNTIIGRTTAMSSPHWIRYTIYVGKAESEKAAEEAKEAAKEAAEAKIKIADKAPVITGLEYESTEEVEYAEYFRIFNYNDGIKLLSIDITDNTELKEEYTKNAEKALENSENEDGLEYDEEGNIVAKSKNETIEALYHNNVVNYLLFPEDVEVPAGLDKEYVIVTVPSENAFVGSTDSLNFMDALDVLESAKLLGVDEDTLKAEGPEQILELIEAEKCRTAGDLEKPDYAQVVRADSDLVLLPGELLPEEIGDKDKDNEELKEEAVKKQEQLEKLESRFTALGAPIVIDRSQQEEEELGSAEWIKVYGAIFGCSDEASRIFERQVKEVGE